jgi:hypothetical protein
MINIPHTVVIFLRNGKKGKESKIPERQRESVCVRGREVAKRGGVILKMTIGETDHSGLK